MRLQDILKHHVRSFIVDDGSLRLYIRRESLGKDKGSYWLPAPKAGGFSLNLRLYWPRPAVLDGTWKPSAVQRVE